MTDKKTKSCTRVCRNCPKSTTFCNKTPSEANLDDLIDLLEARVQEYEDRVNRLLAERNANRIKNLGKEKPEE